VFSEMPSFANGTIKAENIAAADQNGAFSLVGGDSVSAVKHLVLKIKCYVSTVVEQC
jgi:3-phosphoglycerate kinase